MMKYKIPTLFIVVLAFGLAFFYWQKEPAPLVFTEIKGISIISPPVPLPDISLLGHNKQHIDLTTFKNHWTLAFFGYSHCPDICPTSLATLGQVAKDLRHNNANDNTAFVFITLDPARDTPEILKEYVTYFDPSLLGITGNKADIDQLAERVGVIYDYEGDITGRDYVVNHYTAILVFDPKARLRAHILAPHSTEKVSRAFNKIRDYYGD